MNPNPSENWEMDLGFWVGWFGWVGWLAAVLTENSCQQGMGYQSLLQFPPFIQENQLWLKVDLRHQCFNFDFLIIGYRAQEKNT